MAKESDVAILGGDLGDRPFHSQTLSGATKNSEMVNSFWRRNSLNYLQL